MNLSKYFYTNTSVYNIPCAPAGRYDVLIASKGDAQVNVNISQQKPFLAQKLLQYVQTSRIRFENRIHKRQALFKWDKRFASIFASVHSTKFCQNFQNSNIFDIVNWIFMLFIIVWPLILMVIKHHFVMLSIQLWEHRQNYSVRA